MMRKVYGVVRAEYIGFLTGKRVLFMLFAFLFLAEDVVGKMGGLAAEQGMLLGSLEPFILILSYKIHAMIVPIVFVVMLSDFPSNEKSGYFIMSRITRISWVLGEAIYAGLVGLTFVLFLFIGSVLWVWRDSSFLTDWSPYMSELYKNFPDIYDRNNQLFIKTETLAQGKPVEVMLHSVCLLLLYLIVLALLMILFKLLSLKRIGIFLTVSLTITGVALEHYTKVVKWFFPITQSIYETHFDTYYARTEFPIAYSYVYFCMLIGVLCAIDIWLVKHYAVGTD